LTTKMTMTPAPTDKLDAPTIVVANGPEDEMLVLASGSYGVVSPDLTACLSLMRGNVHVRF
jgi:hypothetical protein